MSFEASVFFLVFEITIDIENCAIVCIVVAWFVGVWKRSESLFAITEEEIQILGEGSHEPMEL